MNVVIQHLNTNTMTIEYICKALLDIKAQEDGYNTTIKLSLDLTRPEFVSATKLTNPEHGVYFHCEYNRFGRVMYTADVYPKSVITDVNTMLKAVEKQIKDEELEDACYKAYQLDWMMSHGYSLDDLYRVFLKYEQDMFDPADFRDRDGNLSYETEFAEDDLERAAMQARDIFLFEQGFGSGEIFACKREFLENEFRDISYMTRLFKSMKGSTELEQRYVARFLPEWKGEAETPA